MTTTLRLRRTFARLGAVIIITCALPGAGSAGVQDSRFEISTDGRVHFEVQDVARREVMARLFADQDVRIEWLNVSVADEKISGTFAGTRADVAKRLLAETSYAFTYRRVGDQPQIAAVVVIGPLNSGTASATQRAMPAIESLIARGAVPVIEPAAKDGNIKVIEPVAGDGGIPVITPTADGQPPQIVPVPAKTPR